jgi:hypothetical protein
MRNAASRLATLVALCTVALTGTARAQSNPIDDVIKLAIDAFNDFKYPTADTIARRVLAMQSATPAQRTRANLVIAAAAYPEEASAQRRSIALATLKQVLRTNYDAKLPPELTWAGLDSLFDEAKRTTFALQVTAEPTQTAIGVDGTAKIHVKSNKRGLFRVIIASKGGSGVAVVDSLMSVAEGDITFRAMRDERPIFVSGDYTMTVTAFEPGARGDTVTVQYTVKADAPPIVAVPIPSAMDSSKLLRVRSGKYGAKAILPALLVGGAAFAFGSQLRGEGNISTDVPAGSQGTMIGGALALTTIIAGFMDRGRPIPANIAANKAAGEAFQKSITDAQAENRRRIVEFKTVLTFDLESK